MRRDMNRFRLKRRISPSTEGPQGDRSGNDGDDHRGISNDKRLRSGNSVDSTGGTGSGVTDGSVGAVQNSSESACSGVPTVLGPQPKVSKMAPEAVAVDPLNGLKTRGSGNVASGVVDGLCLVCKENISQYNAQRRTQHVNRCIDHLENARKEEKLAAELGEKLASKVLECPICGKQLKTQKARHAHLKKCASAFKISPVALMEGIKIQKSDYGIQLASICGDSSNSVNEEMHTGCLQTSVAAPVRKPKRKPRTRLDEPQNKLEEDTHFAIALSASIDDRDRRNSLLDFADCSEARQRKLFEEEKRIPSNPSLVAGEPISRDAFSLLMSQMTKPSVLPAKRGKKNKIVKQSMPLLALDQDVVKQRLAEKAAAMVLHKEIIFNFHDGFQAVLPLVPKSKLSEKFCCRNRSPSHSSRGFLWSLAGENQADPRTYYVQELVPPIVISEKCQPKVGEVDRLSSSVLFGSTQTAVVLAELAAEAGDDVSLCDDISQMSVLPESQTSNAVLLKDESEATHVKGFCLTTAMEVHEKTVADLLCAWSEMVDNRNLSDLALNCSDGETIHLHMLVMNVRHPHLVQLVDSGMLRDLVVKFSKASVLPVFRFIYCADTDVPHSVIFDSLKLAESLQLNDFCKICQSIIANFDLDLAEPAPMNSATNVAASIDSIIASNKHEEPDVEDKNSCEKLQNEIDVEDDLDEVYEFALTQRKANFLKEMTDDKTNGSVSSEMSSIFDDDANGDERQKFCIASDSVCINSSSDECENVESNVLRNVGFFVNELYQQPTRTAEAERSDLESAKVKPIEPHENLASEFRGTAHVCKSSSVDAILVDSDSGDPTEPLGSIAFTEQSQTVSNNDVIRSHSSLDLDTGRSPCFTRLKFKRVEEKSIKENSTSTAESSSQFNHGNHTNCSQNHRNDMSLTLVGRNAQSGKNLMSTMVTEKLSSITNTNDACLICPYRESICQGAHSSANDLEILGDNALDVATVHSPFLSKDGSFSPDLFPSSPSPEHISLSQVASNKSHEDSSRHYQNIRRSLNTDVISKMTPLYGNSFNGVIDYSPVKPVDVLSADDAEFNKRVSSRILGSRSVNVACMRSSRLVECFCASEADLLPDLDHVMDDGNISISTENMDRIGTAQVEEFNCHGVKTGLIVTESCNSQNSQFCHRTNLPALRIRVGSHSQSAVAAACTVSQEQYSCDEYEQDKAMTNASSDTDDKVILLESDADSNEVEMICVVGKDDKDENNGLGKKSLRFSQKSSDSETNIPDEDIWENFPEDVPFSEVFSPDNHCTSKAVTTTPKSRLSPDLSKRSSPRVIFSPPTDVETDVSALLEGVANSSLLDSDASFEKISTLLTEPSAARRTNGTFEATDVTDASGVAVKSPATPMSGYGGMDTPALQNRCRDYGIRRLPKRQMVKVLQNIYYELHPGVQREDVGKRQAPKTKPKKKQNCAAGSEKTLISTFKAPNDNEMSHQRQNGDDRVANSAHQKPFSQKRTQSTKEGSESEEDDSIEALLEESALFSAKDEKTKSNCQAKLDDCGKKQILWDFFSKNDEIYERILNYEPLELDFLKKLLSDQGIKIASSLLVDFLDEQNILFTTRSNRTGSNSHRGVSTKEKGTGR